MKFKPVYLYGILLVAVIGIIIVATNQREEKISAIEDIANKEMPKDDVHKNLGKDNPHGQVKVSEEVKKKMEELKAAVDANPNDTTKIREYADFLLAAHKPDESIQYYEMILKKDPKRKDIRFSLTFIYYNKGELDKAEEETNKILAIDKNDSMAKYNLGAIEATRGNNEKAREIWNKLIQDDPKSETAELARNALTMLK
ncbi:MULTISPECIES: tetratricopeptide repeat protein [Ignavibacterium]|uniref:tetratricopeptide repeat protein n=1 Tax=Ignavibacterium TaxID=795750 RepID=UPI0025BA2A08|nr:MULTISPECIES: tetratricopeptide repeat protein [Ignavibacterium]MBI5661469.1 tetratricopeptide repeat protein [Ignavibacterium album]